MKAELVFVPSPGISHLGSMIEIAKLLVDRDERLSISVIIMKFSNDTKVSSFVKSLPVVSSRLKFVELDPEITYESGTVFVRKFIESHKVHVRDFLSGFSNSDSVKLSGIVVDMFCTSMMDVANEFEVPSYVFSTSGAAMLGLLFRIVTLGNRFAKYLVENKDSVTGLSISTYQNLVPGKLLPSMILEEGGCDAFIDMGKRFRETKGIIVNTFLELESYAIEALSIDKTIPPVYTGGPIFLSNGINTETTKTEKIMKWLDVHPKQSVVFICFGSYGHFEEPQVKEIAYALEGSGHRFLWSLRKPPPPPPSTEGPDEYENLEEVLPVGFLQRTSCVGMVIGWAPQVSVLSHVAIGGFVSHCGWNSILESIWFGVPIATWPLFAEQQMNAFELVKDLGLAVEIKMDYRRDLKNENSEEIVRAEVIEDKIKKLMDPENEIRKKMMEMKEKSKLALEEGGSSSASLKDFINVVVKGLP